MGRIHPNSGPPVSDVLFGLVGLAPVPFALEAGEAGLFAALYTAEEILVSGVQVLQLRLKRNRIHFFEPQQFFL